MADRVYPFSSVQVNFPEIEKQFFLEKTNRLIQKKHLYQPNTGRYGLEDRPHVTVLYGLHDEKPSLELMGCLSTYPKFTMTLGKISLFRGDENNNEFDVVKAEVNSSDLHVLNAEICDICEYTNDYPEYVPHATVAYVQKGTCDDLEGSLAVKGLAIPVTEIIFSGKNGIKRPIPIGTK